MDTENLLRVHGSLLWSLGKIISTPEVPRVYFGSYRNEKNLQCENLRLIEREEKELLQELSYLPSNTLIRKINFVARRCRQVRVHALIMSYLKEHSSHFWFRAETKKHEMIEHLEHVFHEIFRLHPHLVTLADFPDVKTFQQQLEKADWSTFHQLKHHDPLIDNVNDLLGTKLSDLIHEIRYAGSSENEDASKEAQVEATPSPLLEVVGEGEEQPATNAAGKRRGKFHGTDSLSPSASEC